jgi:hypothetical protein
MAQKKAKKPVLDEALIEAVTEEKEVEVEAVEVVEVKEEVKKLTLSIYRDNEGRIVIEGEGLSKRIAATDEVLPEVARQVGELVIKNNLI